LQVKQKNMDPKSAKKNQISKHSLRYRLFDSLQRRPFLFVTIYAAAACGFAYGMSGIYRFVLSNTLENSKDDWSRRMDEWMNSIALKKKPETKPK
jgi:hypothetical protein